MKVPELIARLSKPDPKLLGISPRVNGDFSDDINVDVDTTDGVCVVIVKG